jgi:glycosyltransferase involved in cell wall biosynthesis
MKIAHVTEYCHIGSTGGTERYILDLATELSRQGHANEILWMTPDDPSSSLRADPSGGVGIPIRHLPRSAMRVDDPPPDLELIARSLLSNTSRPDVLHFHTFGRSEAVLAKLAVDLHIPYVFTYHSPAWTCRRETLLRWGRAVCDGEVRAVRCAACKLQERFNSPAWLGYLGALASGAIGPIIPGGVWRRRVAFTHDTEKFRLDLRRFLADSALSVACAEWSIPVLVVNGARSETVTHLPQGVPDGFPLARQTRPAPSNFTIGYIGRMHEVKGLHILIEAFRQLKEPQARLRICGWSEAPQLQPYGRLLKRLAGDDARIQFIPEQSQAAIAAEYAGLSLLAIPSVWMETGPLTLLEALQSGVPVYGSSHIGQRSLLEQYGQVIDPNTPEAWTKALAAACQLHQAGRWHPVRLVAPLTTMVQVAARMEEAYRRLLPS